MVTTHIGSSTAGGGDPEALAPEYVTLGEAQHFLPLPSNTGAVVSGEGRFS